MRTLDPILESALSEQQGAIILRVNTWTDAADYAAKPTAPDHVWTCRSFKIEATNAEAELVTENDYTLSAFTVFTIERGVKLSGTEYTIESGLMHVRKYKEEYGKISITGSSYPNQKINITAGDGTYQEVIEEFCTAIGKTAVFKNSADAWLNYQFLPTGKSLSLNKAELFENLLKQKYCILVYEESPNNLVFYNQDSYQSAALSAIAENAGVLFAVATSGANGGVMSTAGTEWIAQTLPSFYNDITYAASLWVAVGASVCATSTDGVTWTARTIPAGTYTSLTYGNSLFVAVGTNVCATSPDGITWTARTIATGPHKSVIWSSTLSLFVVTGTKILTSTDGTTWLDNQNILDAWTARTPSAYSYKSIEWSPSLGLFAAISNDGIFVSSPDGTSWTDRTSTATRPQSIAWSPSLAIFAAVGFRSVSGAKNGASSTNGTSWTDRTVVADTDWYNGVAWSPSLAIFAAVGLSGNCASSTDGTSWTTRTAAEAVTYNAVAWSPELALFAAVSNAKAMTSTNGTSWTARTMPTGDYLSVAWSPSLGLFAAVGTNICATSTDGTTWTSRTISANAWKAVAWSPKTSSFMAVSATGTATSTNGTTWTDKSSAEANSWNCVTWSEELELFVAMSTSGTNRAMTCPVLPYNLRSITQSSSLLVTVGVSACYTSTNGTTWTSRTIPTGTYNSITYGNSLFVAVGEGVAATSTDGTTWTARTPPALYSWKDVVYSTTRALFTAVSSNGASNIMTSSDGITWIPNSTDTDFELSYLSGPRSYLDRQQSTVHFIWRDENSTVYTSGDTNEPQWNLGFLPSTASPPATREDAYYKIFLQKAPLRLDITDGDKILFTPYWSIDPSRTIQAMTQIIERFSTEESPAWYQEIRSIVLFDKTEGGALPSTIERVGAYTPLVSTGFNGNLTPSVNNLQALAQAVDDLPRILTTTERDAIATPRAGLTIFNSSTLKLNFYDGSAWRVVTST